jgi:hypothetical protein
VERRYLICMTSWLRGIASEMTLRSVPVLRRHLYFFTVLFLTAAAANQAWVNWNSNDSGFADSAEAHEFARLQEMAATARSLYE